MKKLSRLLIIGIFIAGCSQPVDELSIEVTIDEVAHVGMSIAELKANVTNNEFRIIKEKGFCWSEHQDPTIDDAKLESGNRDGSFTETINGLKPNSNYHIRAYAIVGSDAIYSNNITVSTSDSLVYDIDGNKYHVVAVGNQEWLKENLKATHFQNGDELLTLEDDSVIIELLADPIYYWSYSKDKNKIGDFGCYYTWYAAIDERNLCPAGWHVPSAKEWDELEQYLIQNGYNYDNSQTKNGVAVSMVTPNMWPNSSELGAAGNRIYLDYMNRSKFSALPSGLRDTNGEFYSQDVEVYWWSSTEDYPYFAVSRSIRFNREKLFTNTTLQYNGLAIRCVRD